MIDNHNHPDVIWVTHEKPGLISLEEIRGRLVSDASVRPYSAEKKIYIVPDAQLMNEHAQNALLKTLEEPPSYVIIILLTENVMALMETIRSRCVRLDMRYLRDDQIEQYLREKLTLPDYQARLCAALSSGSIGRAQVIARSDEFESTRQRAMQLASGINDFDVSRLSEMVRELAGSKSSIRDFLDILTVWYRDVLLFKATQQADRLVFKDQLHAVRGMASTTSYEGLEAVLHALRVAGERLDANVNFDLTMELLLLTMKEN